jgi:hypothetical protein
MAQTQFQDGFPQDPREAIAFSYFLPEQEKQEWYDWLNSASQADQSDLVNTLHEIWIENQKSAAPTAPVPTTQPQEQRYTPIEPTPPSQPTFTPPQGANPFTQATAPAQDYASMFGTAAAAFTPPTPTPPAPISNALPPIPDFMKKMEDELKSVASPDLKIPPAPNPFSTPDATLPPKEEVRSFAQPQQATPARPSFNFDEVEEEMTVPVKPEANKAPISAETSGKSAFVNLDEFQSNQTKSILADLTTEFKKKQNEQESILDKMKGSLLGYEQVTNYLDDVTSRAISNNNSIVDLARQVEALKQEIKSINDDVMSQFDSLRAQHDDFKDQIEAIARDQRSTKQSVKSDLAEMEQAFAAYKVDAYKDEGVFSKIDNISRRLAKVEEGRVNVEPRKISTSTYSSKSKDSSAPRTNRYLPNEDR